jgi:hypothetical protein
MTNDPYWNHILRSADLVPAPQDPAETPLPPDPDPPFGMLDGVTPEELARARIAKHKELLTPPADPVALQLETLHGSLDGTRRVLVSILQVLQEIRDKLP